MQKNDHSERNNIRPTPSSDAWLTGLASTGHSVARLHGIDEKIKRNNKILRNWTEQHSNERKEMGSMKRTPNGKNGEVHEHGLPERGIDRVGKCRKHARACSAQHKDSGLDFIVLQLIEQLLILEKTCQPSDSRVGNIDLISRKQYITPCTWTLPSQNEKILWTTQCILLVTKRLPWSPVDHKSLFAPSLPQRMMDGQDLQGTELL